EPVGSGGEFRDEKGTVRVRVGNHLKVGREIDSFHFGIWDNGAGGVNDRARNGTHGLLRTRGQRENEDKKEQNKNFSQIKSHDESLALSKVPRTIFKHQGITAGRRAAAPDFVCCS